MRPLLACALVFLFISFVGYSHLNFFLPPSSHSDFQFQLKGEIVALLVVAFCFAIEVLAIDRSQEDEPRFNSKPAWLRGFQCTSPIAVSIVAINWRQNFWGQEFKPWWLVGNVLIWVLCYWLFGFVVARAIDNQRESEDPV